MKSRTGIVTTFIFSILVAVLSTSPVGAVMYRSYLVDFYKDAVPAPDAYVPTKVIDGRALGVGELKSPQDVFVANDDSIYIVDSGNNRIIHTDSAFNVINVIQSFEKGGQTDTLKNPYSVFVDSHGQLFIADRDNNRIVCLDENGNFVMEIVTPHEGIEDAFPDHFRFRPSKIAVDERNRIYVIVDGLFDGIMQLDGDGTFRGFIGAPSVNPSPWDYFWTMISSSEQRQRSRSYLPTEYSNIDLDEKGFLYTTVSGGDIVPEQRIRRLNPAGSDILIREGHFPPMGEVRIRDYLSTEATSGPSMLVDIVARQNGMYSALCRRRGRVYTYNSNGQLLYLFGGIGQGLGLTQTATALAAIGDRLLVVDSGLNRITVFDPTEYALLIHQALSAYDRGDYEEATDLWEQVLTRNANNELAYVGIGNNYLRQALATNADLESYQEAMDHLKLGNDRKGYSSAFYRYRRRIIGDRFSLIMNTIVIAVLGIYLCSRYKVGSRLQSRWHKNKLYAYIKSDRVQKNPTYIHFRDTWYALRYAVYVIFHPFDGFWDLKHEKRGSTSAATIIIGLVVLAYVFMRQYLGYIFNTKRPETLNIFVEIASVVIPFMIWCVVNWSLTTLMDGKGTMEEIYIASAYALMPIVLIYIPATIISNFITIEEGPLLYLALAVGAIWAGTLMVLGTMVTHEYEMTKTLLIIVAILIGVGGVIFVSLLFFMVIDLIIQFVSELYSEFVYRLH